MSKPLTIDELKALEVGDWVWIVEIVHQKSFYIQKLSQDICIECSKWTKLTLDNYAETWLAYKNKEQAEAKGEIVELPCLRKVTNLYSDSGCEYRVYFIRKDGVNINSFDCYAYKDKSEAERRLAELRGEK